MLVGLALLVFKFGTLDFEAIFGTAGSVLTKDAATVVALLLFAGAIGKSAQLPLQVWLPDAMAGPTPVSALIHAATMVTAGVYLVVRSHVLFEISSVALTVVLVVGVATALFAATCAIAQFDIKRVLAYSTISQLGYMFIAVGMRAYGVAMFFLVAHACYKALMFLGAGSVIHGIHDEQDMRQMGGLRRSMPWTFATFTIGGLGQAGVPPLAGFFAKDALLEVANHTGRETVFVLGSIAAFLTAFYIGRMICMTFLGRARSDAAEHAHESQLVMLVPLVLLAIGVVVVGILQLSPDGRVTQALEPVVGATALGAGLSVPALIGLAVAVALASLALAWWIYGSGRVDPVAFRERLEPMATAAQRGWDVDRAYDVVFVQPAKAFARLISDVVDALVIDGAVNGVGGLVKRAASGGKLVQTGFVRTYALVLFLGVVLVLGFIGVRG
jgi:NADH-quinone oxidoreductase subunit L